MYHVMVMGHESWVMKDDPFPFLPSGRAHECVCVVSVDAIGTDF